MAIGFQGRTTVGQDRSRKNVENDRSGKSSLSCMEQKLQMFNVQYSPGAAMDSHSYSPASSIRRVAPAS